MPFGVKNEPPTYQKVVTKTFQEHIDVFMKIFLGNFTIFSDLTLKNSSSVFSSVENSVLI